MLAASCTQNSDSTSGREANRQARSSTPARRHPQATSPTTPLAMAARLARRRGEPVCGVTVPLPKARRILSVVVGLFYTSSWAEGEAEFNSLLVGCTPTQRAMPHPPFVDASTDAGPSCPVSCLLYGVLFSVIGRQLLDQSLARESRHLQVRLSRPHCLGVPVDVQAVARNCGILNAELFSVFGGELAD